MNNQNFIALGPDIIRRYVTNQPYNSQMEDLEFLDHDAFVLIGMIVNNPHLRELLNSLTQDPEEQQAALLALFRSPNSLRLLQNLRVNADYEEHILDVFRNAIINRRGQNAQPGSPPRNNIEQQEAPNAPRRPARTRTLLRRTPSGRVVAGRRRRLNNDAQDVEMEDADGALPIVINYPLNQDIPDNFVEETINQFNLNGEEECHICYSRLKDEPVCMNFPCGHIYHCRCIDSWRNNSNRNTCPDCRALVEHVIRDVQLPSSSGTSFGKNKIKSKLSQVTHDISILKSI
jgi:hypothetical protein